MNYYGRRRYYSSRYPRRSYRRAYSSTSRSKRRAIGNYRAAIQQTDKTDVNLSVMTKFETFRGTLNVSNEREEDYGVFALNIWDLLRKSDFYQSYANMYDQIKINSIRIKMTPNYFKSNMVENGVNQFYSSYTVVTAWDRTGLSEEQIHFSVNPNTVNKEVGTDNDTDGLYVIVSPEDVATYSSAVTKPMSANSNTTIVRTIYPSTLAEKTTYVNTSDLNEWYAFYDKSNCRYYGIINPNYVEPHQTAQVLNTNDARVTVPLQPLNLVLSTMRQENPCYVEESPTFPFKPTLLVGLLNEKYTIKDNNNNDIEIIPTAQFTVEADIGVTFRGLRKSSIVA